MNPNVPADPSGARGPHRGMTRHRVRPVRQGSQVHRRTGAAVVFGALALAACGGDDGSTDEQLPTTVAWESFQAAHAAVVFPDGEEFLRLECLLDIDRDAVLTEAFGDLDDPAASGLRANPEDSVTTGELGDTVTCARLSTDGDAAGVGVFVAEAPDDFEQYAADFAGVGFDPDAPVDLDVNAVGEEYQGTVYEVCAQYADDPSFDYCEIAWVDDTLNITLFVTGLGAPDLDLDGVRSSLIAQLPALVDDIASTTP